MKRWWCRATRQWRRWRWALAAGALALAALSAAAGRVLLPPRLRSVAEFPRARPADLAHLLADVSAHTLPEGQPWSLDEEAGNYTVWRYAMSWSCGARCRGRVAVQARAVHAGGEGAAAAGGEGVAAGGERLAHGPAAVHTVRVLRQHCHTLPLLPWPTLCDEIEAESTVSGAGERGARLEESAVARCGWAAALLARCTPPAALAAARARHLARLRALLPA